MTNSPAHEEEANVVAAEEPAEETRIEQPEAVAAAASGSTAPEKDVAPAEEVTKEAESKPAVGAKKVEEALPVREKGMVAWLDF